MSDLLTPVLVAGYGRSGTTALMALLGTDPRVALDRSYPFENRYLTYLAKFALLAGRSGASPYLDPVQLCEYDDDCYGPVPWPTLPTEGTDPPLQLPPAEWLGGMWHTFSAAIKRRSPAATHYAEKVPAWVPAVVRAVLPCRTIHLVRDPRDVFLSAREFARTGNAAGFGTDGDMDRARHTAHGLVLFAENERSDRGRQDAVRVRYEDWVERPAEVAKTLATLTGLKLSPDAAAVSRHLAMHKTSADAEASVGRWQREELPDKVRACLESHLLGPMTDYGYKLPSGARPATAVVPDSSMRCSADGTIQRGKGSATVTVTGTDFWVELPAATIRACDVAEVWVCVRGDTGDHCSLYWRGPRQAFVEDRRVHVRFRPSPHRQVLRFRVGGHRLWRGMVEQLRVDLFNGAVTPGMGGDVRWVRLVG